MATYQNITEPEMTGFLAPQGFQKIELPNTDEIVFGKRMDRNGLQLSLRVYTGIVPSGDSRKAGDDAIRVNSFMRLDGDIKKVASSKRVHRVKGWMKNLQDRIDEVARKIPSELCPKCGKPMVLREGKSKEKGEPYKFLGCMGYPICKSTKQVNN
jgi:predicted RNA-binding Zn-ribbon protein involved in translation (DUF1610 family)